MSSENSWENSQSKDVGVLETHVQAVDTSDADPSAEVSRKRQSLSDFLTIVSFLTLAANLLLNNICLDNVTETVSSLLVDSPSSAMGTRITSCTYPANDVPMYPADSMQDYDQCASKGRIPQTLRFGCIDTCIKCPACWGSYWSDCDRVCLWHPFHTHKRNLLTLRLD